VEGGSSPQWYDWRKAFGLGILGAANATRGERTILDQRSPSRIVSWHRRWLVDPLADCSPRSVGTLGGILNLYNQLAGIAAPVVTGTWYSNAFLFRERLLRYGFFARFGIGGYVFLLGRIERSLNRLEVEKRDT